MISTLLAAIFFLLVAICNLTSTSIFLRCRLMMAQTRVLLLALSQQAVVYSILAVLSCILMLVRRNPDTATCPLFQTVLSVGVMTPVVLSTYMTLDKYMSLIWPFWHARVITPKVTIMVSASLVFSTFALGCVFLAQIYLSPNVLENNECYRPQYKNDVVIEVVVLTLCIVLAMGSWIGIICHTKSYTTKVVPRTSSRENISRYVGTFQMLILIFSVNFVQYMTMIPIYVVDIIRIVNRENIQLEMIHMKMSIGFFVTILINPMIYIFKFRECHYHVLKVFCFCSKRLQEKAERLESAFRLEHARIPTPVSHTPVPHLDKSWQLLPKTQPKNLFTLQIPDKEQHQWTHKKYKNTIKLFVKTRQDIPSTISIYDIGQSC